MGADPNDPLRVLMREARTLACHQGAEFLTLEHVLLAIVTTKNSARELLEKLQVDLAQIERELSPVLPAGQAVRREGLVDSTQFRELILLTMDRLLRPAGRKKLLPEDLLEGLLQMKGSQAQDSLVRQGVTPERMAAIRSAQPHETA